MLAILTMATLLLILRWPLREARALGAYWANWRKGEAHTDYRSQRHDGTHFRGLFLAAKARVAEFDSAFYAVQAPELAAGAVNITLLGLNMRDGLRMKGRLLPPPA